MSNINNLRTWTPEDEKELATVLASIAKNKEAVGADEAGNCLPKYQKAWDALLVKGIGLAKKFAYQLAGGHLVAEPGPYGEDLRKVSEEVVKNASSEIYSAVLTGDLYQLEDRLVQPLADRFQEKAGDKLRVYWNTVVAPAAAGK